MKEQLITFETAKLAKYKGFEELVSNGFYYDGVETWYKDQYKDILILRPSQSLLQKWLREKHDIHIVVYVFKPENKNRYCCDIVSDVFEENLEDDQSFDTYEESLEQALYQALELIK